MKNRNQVTPLRMELVWRDVNKELHYSAKQGLNTSGKRSVEVGVDARSEVSVDWSRVWESYAARRRLYLKSRKGDEFASISWELTRRWVDASIHEQVPVLRLLKLGSRLLNPEKPEPDFAMLLNTDKLTGIKNMSKKKVLAVESELRNGKGRLTRYAAINAANVIQYLRASAYGM